MLKIIVLIFIVFAISRAYLRYRDKSLSFSGLFFWSIIWIGILILIFNPPIADNLSALLGPQRGTDTAFFLGITFLFYLIFRLYIKNQELDQQLTALTINISKTLNRSNKNHQDKL